MDFWPRFRERERERERVGFSTISLEREREKESWVFGQDLRRERVGFLTMGLERVYVAPTKACESVDMAGSRPYMWSSYEERKGNIG